MRSVVSPLMNKSDQLQKSKGDINLKKGPTYGNGMWHSVFYLNAQTSLFHTQNECTYAVINVPKQHGMDNKKGLDHTLYSLN